jgi:hypothetical protein
MTHALSAVASGFPLVFAFGERVHRQASGRAKAPERKTTLRSRSRRRRCLIQVNAALLHCGIIGTRRSPRVVFVLTLQPREGLVEGRQMGASAAKEFAAKRAPAQLVSIEDVGVATGVLATNDAKRLKRDGLCRWRPQA